MNVELDGVTLTKIKELGCWTLVRLNLQRYPEIAQDRCKSQNALCVIRMPRQSPHCSTTRSL